MGACNSCVKDSNQKTHEEALISSFEKDLGFFEFHCGQLVKGVDFLQRGGKVTIRKVQVMLETLHLAHAGFQDLSSPLGRFYSRFMQDSTFSASRLELLAVLLCSGDLKDKACGLLFAAGIKSGDQISWAKLVWLLGDLCLIALDFIPDYAAQSLVPFSRTCPANSLDRYRTVLKESVSETVKALEAKVLGKRDSITYQELKTRIESGELAALCYSSRLRAFALETVKYESTEDTATRDSPLPRLKAREDQ